MFTRNATCALTCFQVLNFYDDVDDYVARDDGEGRWTSLFTKMPHNYFN